MKKTQKNRWKLPVIIGGLFLAMIIALSVVALILNNRESGQLGLDNQSDYVFSRLQTSIHDTVSCHLHGDSNSIVINFNKNLASHRNDATWRDRWVQNVSIPAGRYKVSLESNDGYPGRENSNPNEQREEQYYVKFQHGGNTIATSGVTPDLQDNVRSANFAGVVNNSLNIPNSVNRLIIRHKVPYKRGEKPNSLTAVCMMLEPIIDGQCGSITLTRMLYDSAPTENLCAKGTKTEVTETHDATTRTWSWKCKGVNGGHDSEVCQVHGKRSCATSVTQTDLTKYNPTSFILKPNKKPNIFTEGDSIKLNGATNVPNPSSTDWRWIDTKPGTESYEGRACAGKDAIDPDHPYLTTRKSGSVVIPRNGITEHHLCLNVKVGDSSWVTPSCTAHRIIKINPKPASCGPGAGKSYKTIGELDSEKLCSEGHPVFKSSMSGTKQLCNNGIKQTSCYKDGDLSGCAQSVLDACFVPRWEWECQVGDGGEHVNCSSPRSAECGDSYVEGNEECDNGNNNGKICVPEYGKSCKYCDSNCQEQTVVGGDCGNGTREGDEKCDDGSDNGKIPMVGYGKTATYCKTDCTIGTVVGGQCGNGTREGDEECDDGNTTNGDGCSVACQIEEEKRDEEPDCNSSIGNYIWYDTNGNGIQEDIEEGIEGIKVCAFHGNKKYCDTTNKNGKYKIKDLCKGTYTVVVKDVGAMTQTFDPDGKKDNKTKVKLKNNDKHTKADFGYRGKAPSTGLATNIALLIGLSTLITIGILLVMRKKDMI